MPWLEFVGLEGWKRDADALVGWFARKTKPVNFGMLYVGEPDHVAHESGAWSRNTTEMIGRVDELIG